MSDYVLHMNVERLEVALFILSFAISGFIIGILVARALHLPYSETTTMCFTCGMRNISSGAVIATQYFPGEVVFLSCAERCFSRCWPRLSGISLSA
ncbi:MAG: hypothetical protein ACLTYW_04555 [Collinsella sp.]